jgi:hypothetical protein
MELGNPAAPSGQPAQPAGGPGLPKPNKKLITIIVGAVLGLSVLGWVGNMIVGKVIGFGVRKAIEANTGVKVDENGGVVSFKGKDGAEVRYDVNGTGGTVTFKDEKGQTGKIETAGSGTAKSLPSDFPSDFPVMSGMSLDSTWSLSQPGQGTSFMIGWKTTADAEQISQFYRTELESRGWTKVMESTSGNMTSLAYQKTVDQEKGTNDVATINIEVLAEGTTVTLSLNIAAR